jgi:hypothetical protein
MNPSESARRLRVPGYLVMAAMTVVQVADVVIRAWPFRVHSPAWRLGAIGFAANAVGTPMLTFLVILAIAVAMGDRGVAYLVSSLSALSAALCLLATGVFALDALQMRGQAPANLSHQYDVASFWLVIRVLIAALVFMVIGVTSLRVAKGVRRETPRTGATGTGSPLVVGSRPGAPSPAGPQRSIGGERGN